MIFPALTAAYGALLALVFMALSIWVVAGRAKFRVIHGDGDNEVLLRRMRSHANFAEYVPLILLLIALLEGGGGSHAVVHALLLILLVARVLHPFGMVAREGSVRQIICRGMSAVATWLVMIISAVLLLVRLA